MDLNPSNRPLRTEESEQYLLNMSFDRIYQLLMVGLAGYNASTNDYDRIQVDTSGNLKVASVSDTGSPSQATGQITVASTATQIIASRSTRRGVVIINHGGTEIYLGGSGVLTTTGLFLAGNQGTSIYIPTTAALYGIAPSGTQAVSYMEIYS